jgi:Ser/Thr protein kinase RdoA (MazF antagonist)
VVGIDQLVGNDVCTLVRVKYRVGESLRVVYQLDAGGRDQLVTGRLFPHGRSWAAYERAQAGSGSPRTVSHDPELGAVWWTFPRDRKLGDLGWLMAPNDSLVHEMRLPAWRRTDVVQYVPERSLTVRALDDRGATLAYGKAYGPAAARASVTARRHRQVAREVRRSRDLVSAPDSLAWSDERGLLLMQAMPGLPWSVLAGDRLGRAMGNLGVAIALLHGSAPAPGLSTFGRLRPDRIEHCAQILARARPDVAAQAGFLAERLRAATPEPAPDVVLHGDCHPGNALVDGDAVALVDLDQMGLGPAAADLGSLIARLRYAVAVGDLGAVEATDLEARFLTGYAERRPLPDASSLAWHTAAALVAERALRAVNRVNRAGLAHLAELMAAAEAALEGEALR